MRIVGGNILLDAGYLLKKAQIEEGMKVADFGCGATGHFVFSSADLVGKNGMVYAVDILKTVLETIKRRVKQDAYENIETVWTNLEVFGATKIESGSLDAGLLINTLYQSHKRAEILRESIRMIKKGGRLMIVEWKNIASPLGPPAKERVKADLIKIAARKLGLDLFEEFEAGQYHYGMLFVKM